MKIMQEYQSIADDNWNYLMTPDTVTDVKYVNEEIR